MGFKVRRAAPDLDAWYVWQVATAYQVAVEKGTEADRDSLDALLAFAPWRSLEAAQRFREWASRAHPDWFTRSRFIIAPAWKPLDEIAREIARDPPSMGNVAGLLIATQIHTDLLRAEVERLKAETLRHRTATEEEEPNESPREP